MQEVTSCEFVDTQFEVEDQRFEQFILSNVKLKRLATGFDWVEGPVWLGDSNCLLFSDIPNNCMYRWSDDCGLSRFRTPSNYSNGNTRDRQGRLLTCEHGTRRVTRTEPDGQITVIADQFDDKQLNSPNDVIVKSDGSIWFTDPHYGIMTNNEGFKSEQELPCNVYRWDNKERQLQVVIENLDCPNGLAFSPDETRLYVSDTGRFNDKEANPRIWVYEVTAAGKISTGQEFYQVDPGLSDGLRIDYDGNIWTSAGDGVHCISKSGELLGKLLVPEVVSNLCLGGRCKNRLFMTGCSSLYSIVLNVQGCQWP